MKKEIWLWKALKKIIFVCLVLQAELYAETIVLNAPSEQANKEALTLLSFIDVGEGDAILVESGGESALIDSGNLISAYSVVEYLKQRKVEKLNALILTHPHPDHIGGSFFISQAFKPALFADNGEELSLMKEDIYRWYNQIRKEAGNYRQLKKGDQIKVGKAVLNILWPPMPGVTSDWNSNSLVISLEVSGFRALLMGDGNHATENALLASGIELKSDIFKAGHHGSSQCCGEKFIEALMPQYCVISVNKGNLFGKPDDKVLKRLRSKSELLLTSEDGTVVFEINDDGTFKKL